MNRPLDELVAKFSEDPEDLSIETTQRTVTFRVPGERLMWVDALAGHAGLSRSAMLAELVRVGVSEVLAALPDSIREEIEFFISRAQEAEADGSEAC